MKPFSLELAKVPRTEFCTRHGYKAEVLSFNDKKYNSSSCKRPIKYKIFYNNGITQIKYCDINGRCNSNKYIMVDTTHDLMIKN